MVEVISLGQDLTFAHDFFKNTWKLYLPYNPTKIFYLSYCPNHGTLTYPTTRPSRIMAPQTRLKHVETNLNPWEKRNQRKTVTQLKLQGRATFFLWMTKVLCKWVYIHVVVCICDTKWLYSTETDFMYLFRISCFHLAPLAPFPVESFHTPLPSNRLL